jgi:hypothetical protein
VVEDNICLAGAPLLNGTRAMEGYVSDSDATVGKIEAQRRRVDAKIVERKIGNGH